VFKVMTIFDADMSLTVLERLWVT